MLNIERRAVEYVVVSETTIPEFERRCTKMLRDGYEPIGGICFNNGMWTFTQAFIRYETEVTDLGPS